MKDFGITVPIWHVLSISGGTLIRMKDTCPEDSKQTLMRHCKERREERIKLPDTVTSCEMKARSSKEDWMWQRVPVSYPKMCRELGRQQALEEAVDLGDVTVVKHKGFRFS